MKSTSRGLIITIALATLGFWGCAQNRSGANTAAKLRELEARHAKLEEDYQAVVLGNESIRKRLAAVESQRVELAQQLEKLQTVVHERDELKEQITARTGERDALHAQMIQFGKELQNMVGRVEAATHAIPKAETVKIGE
jgi:outer membrane murein-binding lipoprotein Lpp